VFSEILACVLRQWQEWCKKSFFAREECQAVNLWTWWVS